MHTDPITRPRRQLAAKPGRYPRDFQVGPNGGEPGRPWQRALKRAYTEDQQRKTRTPQRELVEADIASSKRTLPKATKLDRGSLAGIKQTGPQRLCKRYVRKPDTALTPHLHSVQCARLARAPNLERRLAQEALLNT